MSIDRRTKKRYDQEIRFQWYGRLAIAFSLFCLAFLLGSVLVRSASTFTTVYWQFDVATDRLKSAGVDVVYQEAKAIDEGIIASDLIGLLAPDVALRVQQAIERSSTPTATLKLPLSYKAAQLFYADFEREADGVLNVRHQVWLKSASETGMLKRHFRMSLFSGANSNSPVLAGFYGALKGSLMALGVAVLIAFPIGIAAAIYLEEFAPNSRFISLVELNINNLAAVPSIIYGLLGLGLYINWFNFPRAVPVVAGLVLALMMLPVVIITCRSALYAVPSSVRMAAIGIGASPQQVVLHHVLPIAMPRILTGLILSVGQVMGETAPMLLIGTVAFFADVPQSLMDPSTLLPVQIYMWAGGSEVGFVEVASASIVVLLLLLVSINVMAALLRLWLEYRSKGNM